MAAFCLAHYTVNEPKESQTVSVEYYGISLLVPPLTRHIATDEKGHIYAFSSEIYYENNATSIDDQQGFWTNVHDTVALYIESDGFFCPYLHLATAAFSGDSSQSDVDVSDLIFSMELVENFDKITEVHYFGHDFEIPSNVEWLAVDGQGNIVTFENRNKPTFNEVDNSWFEYDSVIGKVTFKGDWRNSLVSVKQMEY